MLPLTAISDGVASLIVTFFGLLATAILAALSLLVGNVLSSAWTVSKLISLKAELDRLVARMTKTLFILVLGSVIVIVHRSEVLAFDASILPLWLPSTWPLTWVAEGPQRVVQGLVVLSLGLCIDHVPHVSRAIKRVLSARYELALADSRRRTIANAPTPEVLKASFPTPKEFGAKVPLGD
ncbi:hypothetical protein ACVDG3_06860 [Meridianimarinicoccus sp. RP-17]|uniref:hypothetical protein n=1 Tax=Meridianimarinicoccus zhengii TaxID=2056810 RepID=UPI0013A6CF35|nr:hypothetical protein [Phycocomes zhengii]